ncbi:heme exporter protein CcmD [Paracidovorax wautersii]|uniref:Heme exporter protein D n=1 Tax=Paracidovorax wautersii TaxID=1177982 RepID=A0ABU1IDB6_9BURK|nr:heme exporter protein CcmD [Paracidovorax wautersii]MDR6214408.1 heme exporter protein CcmD [Paracidovorax wautersii]
MNSLQDHNFFILISYGVSALLVAAEVALLWRRGRAHRAQGGSPAVEDRP